MRAVSGVRKVTGVNKRKVTSCPVIILHSYSYPVTAFWSSLSFHFWTQSFVPLSSLSSRHTARLYRNCQLQLLLSPADGHSPLRVIALRHGRKIRQIFKGMYLEITAIGKNLSPLLISLPSGVQPNLEMLTFVTTCLRLLDCLKHRSAQSTWPNSYSFWCSSW